jgi:hypothetical protein
MVNDCGEGWMARCEVRNSMKGKSLDGDTALRRFGRVGLASILIIEDRSTGDSQAIKKNQETFIEMIPA